MAFSRGDVVVLNLSGSGFAQPPATLPMPYGVGTRYVVEQLLAAGGNISVSVEGKPELGRFGGYYSTRFKLAPAKREATAMTLETARAQRQKLIDAGVPAAELRIRSRSWDREGLYFAVDIDGGTKFYTPAKVDEFLAARKPIDAVPFLESTRMNTMPIYQFRVGATGLDPNGIYLVAPDGSYWWSEADMKRVGGIVTALGRRYRLGRNVFTPFIS